MLVRGAVGDPELGAESSSCPPTLPIELQRTRSRESAL